MQNEASKNQGAMLRAEGKSDVDRGKLEKEWRGTSHLPLRKMGERDQKTQQHGGSEKIQNGQKRLRRHSTPGNPARKKKPHW